VISFVVELCHFSIVLISFYLQFLNIYQKSDSLIMIRIEII